MHVGVPATFASATSVAIASRRARRSRPRSSTIVDEPTLTTTGRRATDSA